MHDERELLHHEVTRDVIAAFYKVKNELGLGFPENVYSNALAVALGQLARRVTREVRYEVVFQGVIVGAFRADLVVDDCVIVEVKTARTIVSAHKEQVHHYLLAAKLTVGMVLNFGDTADFARVLGPSRH